MPYIVKQRIRSKVYVYSAENTYRPEIGQSRQTRTYLGTLGEDGMFVIGRNVAPPDAETVGLLEKAGIRVDFSMRRTRRRCPCGTPLVDGRCPLCSGAVSGVNRIGVPHVLHALAAESGLDRCLRGSFGERGSVLLSLAVHRAGTGRPLYLAEPWLAGAGVSGHDFSSGNLSRFVRDVGADLHARESFLSAWYEACGRPSSLVCDITSISTHSDRLKAAEWGYNRDRESLPQINIALVSTRDGAPLAYRILPGSVPDVSTLSNTAEFLEGVGFGKAEFSLDKGFYSRANLQKMAGRGISYVIGVPFSNSRAQKMFSKHMGSLRSGKRSFLWSGRVMRHAKDSWEVETPSGATRVAAHLYYEPARAADMMAEFEKRILTIERMSAEAALPTRRAAREWIEEHARRDAGLFRLIPSGMGFAAERKPKSVASEMKFMGCTLVLCSDAGRGREDSLSAYRSRDKGEKLFDILKNEIGQDRLRTGSDTAAEGQVFLSLVALALRALLETRMRGAGLIEKHSSDELLAEMDKISSVKLMNGRSIMQEITKKQRGFLAGLKIAPPCVV